METKWLEDLFVLAETRNFSQAAQLRHITQSAFSRRIQSLEAWAGAELVDRSAQPPKLTPAGEFLYRQAAQTLEALSDTRSALRAYNANLQDTIDFAATPVLGFSFYPAWSQLISEQLGIARTRLVAQNSVDSLMFQDLGKRFDFMLAYHHPSLGRKLDSQRHEMLVLKRDVLAPFSKLGSNGRPLFALATGDAPPTPYLAYASGTCLGQLTQRLLDNARTPVRLDPVYETDMVIGLKAMMMQGHGLAFLPRGAVEREIDEGKAGHAMHAPHELMLDIDVCMYRRKPSRDHVPKQVAQALWDHLARCPASAPRQENGARDQAVPHGLGDADAAPLGGRLFAVSTY